MFACDECRVGRLHPTRATYLQPMADRILVFPQAPALRCDVCGQIEFDTFFTDMMEALIWGHLDHEPTEMMIQSLVHGAAGHSPHRFKMM